MVLGFQFLVFYHILHNIYGLVETYLHKMYKILLS